MVAFPPCMVELALEDRNVTRGPVVPLKAHTGGLNDLQQIEYYEFEWGAVSSCHPLRKDMFVVQVGRQSMRSPICISGWCFYRAPVEAKCRGKIVRFQLCDTTDPEIGKRFTIMSYQREMAKGGESWCSEQTTLESVNLAFNPIALIGADKGEFRAIPELVEFSERNASLGETDSR